MSAVGTCTGMAVGVGMFEVVGTGLDVGRRVGVGTAVAVIPGVGEGSGIDVDGLKLGVDISGA